MRFCVLTFGNEGDTRPLAALCTGLMRAGHELRMWADRSTLAYPESQGIPCGALAGDMLASVRPGGALEKLMKDGGGVREMMNSVARLAKENTAAWMEPADWPAHWRVCGAWSGAVDATWHPPR